MMSWLLYRLRLRGDRSINESADILGSPHEWVICPHCGAQDWRFPPHGIGEPCPLVERIADSTSLKFDAERMGIISSRQQAETAMKFFEQHFGEMPDSDEEEGQ